MQFCDNVVIPRENVNPMSTVQWKKRAFKSHHSQYTQVMYTKDIITKYFKIKAKKILYTSNMGAKNSLTQTKYAMLLGIFQLKKFICTKIYTHYFTRL